MLHVRHILPSRFRSHQNPSPPCPPGWAKWQRLRMCSRIRVCSQPSRSGCVSSAPALGSHDLIDFVAVLIGSVLSGEPTRLSFYERLAPWALPFMALFGRDRLPHRSTLSRFLAALDQPTVEALRTRFQEDVLARNPFPSPGGLFDRTGRQWLVIDVDGTRQAARQRALPQTDALPAPSRRCDQVCAPGYQGRKRGEVIRTRTVVLQTYTHQFLGTQIERRASGTTVATCAGLPPTNCATRLLKS
jgi:hypothetical protein